MLNKKTANHEYMRSITASSSTGRPCVPEDGDNALMAKETVLCPEAGSTYYANSLDGQLLPVQSSPTPHENRGQSQNNEQPRRTKESRIQAAEELRERAEKIWKKV